MSKIALFGLIAIVVLLVGASVVLAQDAATTTPGTTLASPICPVTAGGAGVEQMRQAMGEGNIEQMQQMHDAMTPTMQGTGMEQMHEAMGPAMQSGDMQQMHDTRQSQGHMNSQNGGATT